MGTIITFYSYKGGVGRSMCLANTGLLMTRWGYKVLMVDWDLEAPGLENFFKLLKRVDTSTNSGLIDIISEVASLDNTSDYLEQMWKSAVHNIILKNNGRLDLITAGKREKNESGTFGDDYYKKVRQFDIKNFYTEKRGGEIIEKLRTAWKQEYDFVLIDSRTGITELGGICTIQLPDILVLLFTATEASFNGIADVAKRAKKAQTELKVERLKLLTLPLLTRVDGSEKALTKSWIDNFIDGGENVPSSLKDIYQNWLAPDIEIAGFLNQTKVPHVAFYSFGEGLPVEEGNFETDVQGIGFSYQSIAGLLATHLNFPGLLITDRPKLLKLADQNHLNKIKSELITKITEEISVIAKQQVLGTAFKSDVNSEEDKNGKNLFDFLDRSFQEILGNNMLKMAEINSIKGAKIFHTESLDSPDLVESQTVDVLTDHLAIRIYFKIKNTDPDFLLKIQSDLSQFIMDEIFRIKDSKDFSFLSIDKSTQSNLKFYYTFFAKSLCDKLNYLLADKKLVEYDDQIIQYVVGSAPKDENSTLFTTDYNESSNKSNGIKSLTISIVRVGKAENHFLSPDTQYISTCGNSPEVSFSIDCNQYTFQKYINLFQSKSADTNSISEGFSFFTNLITKIFVDLKYFSIKEGDNTPLHIRLIAAPLELAQLPFEVGSNPTHVGRTQTPLLLGNRLITLTREVRQVNEATYRWPNRPRILFAWAQPLNEVPYVEHRAALISSVISLCIPILSVPDPEPDIGQYFTELPNVSLQSLKKEIEKGISTGHPYTHVHLLVSGGRDTAEVTGFKPAVTFCQDGSKNIAINVNEKNLIASLTHKQSTPIVVSLFSGGMGYELHSAGIPCVFASQFPITKEGSITMVETLYSELINAYDPRVALYKTRLLLASSYYDWASLVAYTRFPEDFNEQLQNIKVKAVSNSMKTTSAWIDHVFRHSSSIAPEKKENVFKSLEIRLDTSIVELSSLLNSKEDGILIDEVLRGEYLAQLGSAYKRKAEYLYRLIEFKPTMNSQLLAESREALKTAEATYYKAFESNTASYWSGIQYLSLKAITEGSLENDRDIWTTIKYMMQKDERAAKNDNEKAWLWGALAELFILEPLLKSGGVDDEQTKSAVAVAKEYIVKISTASIRDNFLIESIVRQLDRYIYWWQQLNSTSSSAISLKAMAMELRNVFPALKDVN